MNKSFIIIIPLFLILLSLTLFTTTNAQTLQDILNVKPDVTVEFNRLVTYVNEAYSKAEDQEELREYFRYLLPTLQSMSKSVQHYGQHFPIARFVNGIVERDAWSTLTILWLMGELSLEVEDFLLAVYSFTTLEALHEEYPDLNIHEGVDADYLELKSLTAISCMLDKMSDDEN